MNEPKKKIVFLVSQTVLFFGVNDLCPLAD